MRKTRWSDTTPAAPEGYTNASIAEELVDGVLHRAVHVPDGGGGAPSGAAGGDLTGTYPNPQIGSGVIVNADVNASAGIVESKLSLNFATHSNTNDPSSGEKSALAGTSGTPGSGNKYVTEAGLTDAALSTSDITTNNVSTSKHGFTPKAPNDATKFLDGTGAWDTVKDSDLSTSDITTNDVSTSKHGFTPKAPNDTTKFLRGDGAWATPSASAGLPAYLSASVAVPAVASLTAVNQSTGTATDTAAGIFMKQLTSSTQYIFALTQSAPATPWVFTAEITPYLRASNFNHCGLVFSDGTKLVTLALSYNSGLRFTVTKWNSATSVSGDYTSSTGLLIFSSALWLRIEDNGTNRLCHFSFDGVNFIQLHTIGRTDFLTASALGIYVATNGGSFDTHMTCSSWSVT